MFHGLKNGHTTLSLPYVGLASRLSIKSCEFILVEASNENIWDVYWKAQMLQIWLTRIAVDESKSTYAILRASSATSIVGQPIPRYVHINRYNYDKRKWCEKASQTRNDKTCVCAPAFLYSSFPLILFRSLYFLSLSLSLLSPSSLPLCCYKWS